jgi:hypothetical protein
MFCEPAYCPAAYTGRLIIGLVLGLALAWFILRTRLGGRLFGGITSISHLRALRPLSRRGRILWVVVMEGFIGFLFVAPALNYFLPLPPALAQADVLRAASFLIAWLALFFVGVDVDRSLE